MKTIYILAASIVFTLHTSEAQLIKVDQAVFGMDCAPCAYGLERGLKKMEGLGNITVSLNDGKAYLSLISGNTLTLKGIQEVVKKNGFSARTAEILAIGELNKSGDEWTLKVNNETFSVAAVTDEEIIRNLAGGRVKLKGEVMDEDDKHLSDKWTIKIMEILPL